MKILITGASGFVGGALAEKLSQKGHQLILTSRNAEKLAKRYGTAHSYVSWDALSGPAPKECFTDVTAIINLMGEGIAAKRWSPKQKQQLADSRIKGTQHLLQGAAEHAPQVHTLLSASAIGIYNHQAKQDLHINGPLANDFLGKLCQDWEAAAYSHQNPKIRTVLMRTGIVLGIGGALEKLLPPIKLGIGGPLGSGKQWMNWIHIDDLVNCYITALENPAYKGPYNAVAPGNCQNKAFTKAIGKYLKRPTLFPVPYLALRLVVGEFAKQLVTGGKVLPSQLVAAEFNFKYPQLAQALSNILLDNADR